MDKKTEEIERLNSIQQHMNKNNDMVYENIVKTFAPISKRGTTDGVGPKVVAKYAKEINYGDRYEMHVHHPPIHDHNVGETKCDSIAGNKKIPSNTDSELDAKDRKLISMSIQRLKNCYRTYNAYMKSLFWDNKKKDFPIKDYFVEVKIQETDYLGIIRGESIDINRIFSQDFKEHLHILVTGDPGFGKTTLCRKLAYDWATSDSPKSYLNIFHFVVVIFLRDLQGKSLNRAILESLCNKSEVGFADCIRKANVNLLIILDGYDEMLDKTSVVKFIRENSFEISREMTILVTTRPHAAEEIREDMNCWYSLGGFSREQQEKYVKLVFRKMQDKQETLFTLLKESKFHSTLAKCPLMLHMLCCLQKNDSLKDIKRKTDLYLEIFRLIIKRYLNKYGKFQRLMQKRYLFGEDILIKFGKLICDKNKINRNTSNLSELMTRRRVTYEDLKENFTSDELQFIISLEICIQCESEDGITYFELMHKTFEDFLIALFLSCNYKEFLSQFRYIYHLVVPLIAIPNYCAIFYYGLCNSGEIPGNYLAYYETSLLSLEFLTEIYNEIDQENTRKMISARTMCYFTTYSNIDYNSFPQYKQIYFITDVCNTYKEIVTKFREMLESYVHSYQIEVLIFLHLEVMFLHLMIPEEVKRVLEQIEIIKIFLTNNKWEKFKIYLCGICAFPFSTDAQENPFRIMSREMLLPVSFLKTFNEVQTPVQISKQIKSKVIGSNDDLVALKFDNEGLNIENSCVFITPNQFKSLKPYIRLNLNLLNK